MSIYSYWHDTSYTLIRVVIDSAYNLTEYYASLDAVHHMITSRPHTVSVVVEFQKPILPPAGMMAAWRYVESRYPNNCGMVVYVNAHPLIETTIQLVRPLAPRFANLMHFAHNLEEALGLVEQHKQRVLGRA